MKIMIIGPGNPSIGEINVQIAVVAIKELQDAFEKLGIACVKTTNSTNGLNLIAEKLKQQSIVYDQPKSKFISKPLNNFRNR